MKWRPLILGLLTVVLAVHFAILTISAHGFDTNAITDEDRKYFLQNVKLELLDEEAYCVSIECFDVNEDGGYAIGFTGSDGKVVQVYDADGTLLYGVRFQCSGNYSMTLRGNNIEIYFVRNDIVIYVNPRGACLSAQEVPLNSHNRKIIDEILDRDTKTVDGVTYYLDRDLGFADRYYARLVKQEPSGEAVVLYDVTARHNANFILSSLLIVVFIGICVIGVKNRIESCLKEENE